MIGALTLFNEIWQKCIFLDSRYMSFCVVTGLSSFVTFSVKNLCKVHLVKGFFCFFFLLQPTVIAEVPPVIRSSRSGYALINNFLVTYRGHTVQFKSDIFI